MSAHALLACASLLLGASAAASWVHPSEVHPGAFSPEHNGGVRERLVAPAAGTRPHIWMLLFDDYGWADAGWHRNYTGPGGVHVPATDEVQTPHLNQLVREGIELNRAYVYKYCSPTRSALQSGRNPYHVNPLNLDPAVHNAKDPVSGFAAIPRNMTGIATKMAAAGYSTHSFGKWDAGMATPDHTPHGRGYMTNMNYFHHCNDYWSMSVGSCSPPSPPGPAPPTGKQLKCSAPGKKFCLGSSPNVKGGPSSVHDEGACCEACANSEACRAWTFGVHGMPGGNYSCFLHTAALKKLVGNCTSNCKFANCLAPMGQPMLDLWAKLGPGSSEGPALGFNNTCRLPQGQGTPGACHPGPRNEHKWWGGYEDSVFEQQVLDTVHDHDASKPLFLFWAPHIVHSPLQVPQQFYDKFSMITPTDKAQHERQTYHAMVNFADEAVGNVTAALRQKEMWDNLLIVFSTDNGGPIYNNGSAGANNFPLKGGKMNNWEGGIRGNSFVSGGFLPAARRGTRYEGLVTVWDWYATFASLAGVDATDHRAALAELPAIDSIDMSAMLMGTRLASPRTEIPIGTEPRASNLTNAPLCSSYGALTYYDDPRVGGDEIAPPPNKGRCTTVSGLIIDERAAPGEHAGLWKLLTGDVQQAVYTGPHYPNSSTDEISNSFVGHCAQGCLYNIELDPLEKHDLATAMPAKVASMRKKLMAYEDTAFNPIRGGTDPKACEAALGKYKGFWGPFVD